MVAQLTVYPIDTLKFRLQCSNLDHPLNAILTAKEMLKDGGVKIFYRGIGVGLAGMFPYAALDLGTFSLSKIISEKYGNKDDQLLPTYLTLSLGAFSGSFAATIVYPVNLLRTRLQSQELMPIHLDTRGSMMFSLKQLLVKVILGYGKDWSRT